jgi:hypothetical protein
LQSFHLIFYITFYVLIRIDMSKACCDNHIAPPLRFNYQLSAVKLAALCFFADHR